jgi:hypothetical protein
MQKCRWAGAAPGEANVAASELKDSVVGSVRDANVCVTNSCETRWDQRLFQISIIDPLIEPTFIQSLL